MLLRASFKVQLLETSEGNVYPLKNWDHFEMRQTVELASINDVTLYLLCAL